MANTITKPYCLGVLVDDVWLSGVQSFNRPSEINFRELPDVGRIQGGNVFIDPSSNINITITRILSDLAQPFYQPADLTNYASTFLLANTNIGMSGWDSLKEYKIQFIWGDDDDAYLGANASTYVALDTFNYCLLTGLNYVVSDRGTVQETITLTTRNQGIVEGGLFSGLSLPSFPESATVLAPHHFDMVNSVFPSVVDSVFDNGWNALNGRDAEHGKYAMVELNMSLNIEYGELRDVGNPRGASTASEQNKWRFVQNTTVECVMTGLARKSDFVKAVNDGTFGTYQTPDDQIKIVAQLGSNYYVWDLGSANFMAGYEAPLGDVPDARGEFSMTFVNRRHDFVPYVNNSILTLTQSGTY